MRRPLGMLPTLAALVLAAEFGAPDALAQQQGKQKAQAKGAFGAIAMNRGSKAVGYAYDFKNARDAKREALNQCGEKQCEVVVSFRGGCAAVSGGGKRLATATGITRDEAETKAARKCGKECAILAWACSKDK